MPYNCEECDILGARMNSIFQIRLCEECVNNSKYKLICKSDAIKKYRLSKSDFENNNFIEKYCKNPYYKSGPPMTLYFNHEIITWFLIKYNNLITEILQLTNPLDNIEDTINKVINHYANIKLKNKNKTLEKILKKSNNDLDDFPIKIQDKIASAKNNVEVERIIESWNRTIKLSQVLKSSNIGEYIELDICKNYINNINITSNEYDIRDKIIQMLDKKIAVKNAINKYKLPKKKYIDLYNNFINSTNNDIYNLITIIQNKELRLNILESKLKLKELKLRSDSVLCSDYLNGSDKLSVDEIVDIMEQMNWFFSNTNYSSYMKNYKEYNKYQDYSDEYESDYEYIKIKKLEYSNRKTNYAKKQSIIEWIRNGKKGIKSPESLNNLINLIENDTNNPKIKNIKNIRNNCNNIYTSKCITRSM